MNSHRDVSQLRYLDFGMKAKMRNLFSGGGSTIWCKSSSLPTNTKQKNLNNKYLGKSFLDCENGNFRMVLIILIFLKSNSDIVCLQNIYWFIILFDYVLSWHQFMTELTLMYTGHILFPKSPLEMSDRSG